MAIIRKSITGLKPGSDYLFTLKPKNVEIAAADSEQETIRVSIPVFSGTPSIITGLQLASNFQTVIFKFDPINDADLSYFEYQLYDNEFGDGNPINYVTSTSNDPILISGTNVANVFLVSVENSEQSIDPINNNVTNVTKQYWGRVRAVNIAGNPSTEWSDLIASGELGLISDSFVASLTAAKITAGTIGAHTITLAGATSIIKSSNYDPSIPRASRQGWFIDGQGNAEFSSASIRGTISAQSIYLNSNNRWGRNSANTADSNEFKVGTSSSYLFYDVANNKVTFTGELSAATGSFSGNITATGGTFSGTITSGYNLTTQFGNNINGATNYSGFKIGNTGWENAWVQRSDGSIYFNAQSRNVAPDGTPRGVSRLYIDDNNALISFNNGTFSVDYNGALVASNASITGTVTSANLTATGGTIGGWLITSNLLQGQSTGNTRVQLLKSVPAITTFYNNTSYHNLPAMCIFDNLNTQAIGYFGSYSDYIVSMEGITGNTWIEIDSDGADSITFNVSTNSIGALAGIHFSSTVQNVWFDGYTHSSSTNQYLRILQDGRAVLGVPSDVSLKQDISTAPSVIDKVKQLNVVNFYWKDKYNYGSAQQIGLIAQELEEVFPSFVGLDHSTNKKNISTDPLLFVCIKSIQELCDKIDFLESKLENR